MCFLYRKSFVIRPSCNPSSFALMFMASCVNKNAVVKVVRRGVSLMSVKRHASGGSLDLTPT